MARRYLGDRFDLHTGGIDNVFPHHEDEIAQSAPLVGGPAAAVWVHGEFLLMAGRKMAKSAGNFQRVTELAERGLDPLAFRYLALTSRYGRKLNYSDRSLKSAAAGLASLRGRLAALGPPPANGPWAGPPVLAAGPAGDRPAGTASGVAGFGGDVGYTVADRAHEPSAPLSRAGRDLHDRFVAALDDDLDLPGALACVREMLRADLPPDERRWLVLDADAVLALDLHRAWEAPSTDAAALDVPADVETLLADRDEARSARDFARADELRRALANLGWDVVDGPDRSTVHRARPPDADEPRLQSE
jgi:cysteinyl-tRNA synthetase